jgi:hypothetical protein
MEWKMNRFLVEAALEQLKYNWHNFTVTDFIQHVMGITERPIILLGVQLDISGLCIITPTQDFIFYDVQRHHTIQLHAILHETAHLVMNHQPFNLSVDDIHDLREILLHINMRSYAIYQNPQMSKEEDEAEYFAFLAHRAIAEAQLHKDANLTDVSEDTFMPPFTGSFRNDN